MAQLNTISTELQTILNSAYFSGLTRYGSDGKVAYGGTYLDTSSDPPSNFDPDGWRDATQRGYIQSEIANAINTSSGVIPPAPSSGDAVYTVITGGQGTVAFPSTVGGSYNFPDLATPLEMISLPLVQNNIEGLEFTFSHELAEGVSDPFGLTNDTITSNYGVTIKEPAAVTPNLDVFPQICDGEPTAYGYRFGGPTGLLLAPYWSNAVDSSGMFIKDQGSFIVPDGNSAQVVLQAAPGAWTKDAMGNENFNHKYDLIVLPTDGTVSFAETSSGVRLDINGQSFFFDPNGESPDIIVGTTVLLGNGNDKVNVESTASTDPITIDLGSGTDTVNISPTSETFGLIHGTVTLVGGGGADTLNIDNQMQSPFLQPSWDVTGASVASQNGTINYFNLTNLVINGSNGINSYTVLGNATLLTTTINTGTGGNTIIVQKTTTPLTINSGGSDTITLGDSTGVQHIQGQVQVNSTGPIDPDIVNVNDTGDTLSRTPLLTINGVFGLAPANIQFGSFALSQLNITGDAISGNTFKVLSTPAPVSFHGIVLGATTTTINSEATDTIDVGDSKGVQDVQGQLVVNGQFPDSATLNIDDRGDTGVRTVTVTRSSVLGLAPGEIDYTNCGALNIDSGSGGDTIGVQSTAAPIIVLVGPFHIPVLLGTTTTTINSSGSDTINVGDARGVQDIQGQLIVNGLFADRDTLVVNDQPDSTSQSVTVTRSSITGPSNEIDYNNCAAVTITSGTGGDTINVQSTAAPIVIFIGITHIPVVLGSTTTTINSNGPDTVNVGDASGVQDIRGKLVVSGSGSTKTVLNDQPDTASRTVTVTTTAVNGLASAEIDYANLATLTLQGGSGGNVFNVQGASSALLIQDEAGKHDTVTIGSLAPALGGTLANIKSTVEVFGNGSASLTVDDSGDTIFKNVTTGQVSGSLYSITGLASSAIEYVGGDVQSLTINAPHTLGQQNSILVNGTPTGTALTVHAGFLGDVTSFVVPGIGGPVTNAMGVDDTTYLLDGPATDNSRVYTITSTSVTRTGGFALKLIYPTGFATSESFALYTGNAFVDTVNVQSTLAGTGWFVDGSLGSNVFNLGDPLLGLATIQGEVHINPEAEPGTLDTETVNLNDQPDKNPQTFTFHYDPGQNLNNVIWNGGGFVAYNNTPPPLANLVINGGSGNTTFQIQQLPAVSTAITLKPGSGHNTLDYSQYVGNVTANLPSGTATGFAAISNIQAIIGSQGNDTITVTPQFGVLFTVTGNNPPGGGTPHNSLTVSTVNGGVSNHPGTVAGSGTFTFTGGTATIVQYTNIQVVQPVGWLVTAPDADHSPEVKVFDAQSGVLRFDITAFDPSFQGGVRVAVGDVNGDGIPDIIAAQGPSGDDHHQRGDDSQGDGNGSGDSLVHVYDGITGQPLAGPLGSFDPFPGFHGGLYVAAADLNGDGYADVIVGQDAGGQGWVKVFSGRTGGLLAQFHPFGTSFTGAVRLAAGPVTSNGHVDVVAGAGPGGPPLVEVFDGPSLVLGLSTPVASFDAFDPSFTGGVYVATGLIHGQGQPPAEIIVGEGAGGEPRVSVFDATGTRLQSFLAFESDFKGGVRVAAADVNGDGRSDIVVAAGPGGLPRVRAFDGVSLEEIDSFFAFASHFRGGVFVGGGGKWGVFNPAVSEHGDQHSLSMAPHADTLPALPATFSEAFSQQHGAPGEDDAWGLDPFVQGMLSHRWQGARYYS